MKTLATALMISASVLAGAVQAAEPEIYPPEINTRSDVSRAQVIAELHAAQMAGLVVQGHEPNYPEAVIAHRTTHDTKTRAEVQAELIAAREAGELVHAEDPSYPEHFESHPTHFASSGSSNNS